MLIKDEHKTRKQLISELIELRRKIAELENGDDKRSQLKTSLDSEEHFRDLLEYIPESIQGYTTDGTIFYWNKASEQIYGYTAEEALGKNLGDLIVPPDLKPTFQECLQIAKKLTKSGEFFPAGELLLLHKKGHFVPVYSIHTAVYRDGNEPLLFCIDVDLSAMKKAEGALQESEEKYRSLVESTNDSIYVVDRTYKYLFMNEKHIMRLGFSGNEYLGQEYSKSHNSEETELFTAKANTVFYSGESITHEYRSNKDGRYFLLTLSPIKKDDGKVKAVTVVSKDITDYKIAEEKLHNLSLTDELTGLYNRRGFFTLAEQFLKLARRQKQGIFMLYADIDNLKDINDTFGHKEGDMALVNTADILRKNYRESDVIARIGGDEFVIIPIGTDKDTIDIITSRFEKSIKTHNSKNKREYSLSLSYGLAYYDPEKPCSLDELLMKADKTMYEHKKHNKNS
jgi:diguanylate cyclase (GGDEF)-like protein/PAS domain S-box-containing protein